MRACEGCRRRKIKCDAATTNTWPCSACTRLKLHCVPPMLQYDREHSSSLPSGSMDHDQRLEFDSSSNHSGEEEYIGIMGKSRTRTPMQYREGGDPYRTLTPHEHHGQPHGHPYPGLPSADITSSPLSTGHYQTPIYHSPVNVLRAQDQPWNTDTENDYASALVGSLSIDDHGVGKLPESHNSEVYLLILD